MNRKEFLKRVFSYGTALIAGSLMKFGRSSVVMAEEKKGGEVADGSVNPAETPCEEKVDFAKNWIKRFMNVMDKNLDEETRKKIMTNCGKECFCSAHSEVKWPNQGIETVDLYLGQIGALFGKENAHREGNKIYFNHIMNPSRGLKIEDGYCLCPLIEDGPEGLSPTYCLCSTGYIKEMFERMMGQPVKVKLLESLRRGGKKCRFLIHI